MIGPLQEETVSIIPSIKFYHNVLFDEEIKIIKELARPEVSSFFRPVEIVNKHV